MNSKVLVIAVLFIGLLLAGIMIALFVTDKTPSQITVPHDPLSLRNKTEAEIESIYGPALSEGTYFDNVSPMKKYRIAEGEVVEIHYSGGLAKGSRFEIPSQWQSDDLGTTLKNCGLADFADLAASANRGWWVTQMPDGSQVSFEVNQLGNTYISCSVDFW